MDGNMEKEKRILEEVDKTLRALDDVPALCPNPFLFQKIQARMASADVPRFSLRNLKLVPIAITLIVLVNLATDAYLVSRATDPLKERLIQSLSRDFGTTRNYF